MILGFLDHSPALYLWQSAKQLRGDGIESKRQFCSRCLIDNLHQNPTLDTTMLQFLISNPCLIFIRLIPFVDISRCVVITGMPNSFEIALTEGLRFFLPTSSGVSVSIGGVVANASAKEFNIPRLSSLDLPFFLFFWPLVLGFSSDL